jgi:hypothetical protein
MVTFLYHCPAIGLNVQSYIADDPTDDEAFESVYCIACTRVHLVNPKAGKVLGVDDE